MPENKKSTPPYTSPASPISGCIESTTPDSEECYAFLCDYADHHAEVIREYVLYFYPKDNSVEMFDPKQRRKFIKRSKYSSLSKSALILGNSVTVFSRQLYLRDYADETTRFKMTQTIQQLYILIPEIHISQLGLILSSIFSKSRGIVKNLCLVNKMHQKQQHQSPVDSQMDPVLLRVGGERCVVAHIVIANDTAKELSNPNQPVRDSELGCVLSQIQGSWPHVCRIECSEFSFLCSMEKQRDGCVRESSVVSVNDASRSIIVIKPHAVLEGHVGEIILQVQSCGLQLRHIQTFTLTRPDAEDFLEIYKGVIPEYYKMVDELISGPLVACEVCGNGNVVEQVRHLSGPYDPELGQVLFPASIRAKFGHDKVKNAVHCTDLVEDAELEAIFFFQLVS